MSTIDGDQRKFMQRMEGEGTAESVSVRPMLTSKNESTSFNELVPGSKISAPASRVTYFVSDRSRYVTNLSSKSSFSGPQNLAIEFPDNPKLDSKTHTMKYPDQFSSASERINARADQIQRLTDIESSVPAHEGRPGNHVAVGVVLPADRAQELATYLREHPDQVRPFFINGGLEHMGLHQAPPYERLDQEDPDRPILFQEFNNQGKLIANKTEKIRPSAAKSPPAKISTPASPGVPPPPPRIKKPSPPKPAAVDPQYPKPPPPPRKKK